MPGAASQGASLEETRENLRDAAFAEAAEHLETLAIRRDGDPRRALVLLRSFGGLVGLIGHNVHGEFEAEARERLDQRDPEDWPVLASALELKCPFWTEGVDFFGCGVATRTSNRVEMYLR